jgi:hypothetical protein
MPFEAAYRLANGWEFKPKRVKANTTKFKAGEIVKYKVDFRDPNKVYIADGEYRADTTTMDNLCNP